MGYINTIKRKNKFAQKIRKKNIGLLLLSLLSFSLLNQKAFPAEKINFWISKPDFVSFPIMTISFSFIGNQGNFIKPPNGTLEVWLDSEKVDSINFYITDLLQTEDYRSMDKNAATSRFSGNYHLQNKNSLLILLDISGSMGYKRFQQGKILAQNIVENFYRKIPVSLGTFGDYVFIPATFNETPNSLKKRLQGLVFLSEKKTLLYQALAKAINSKNAAKQILLITDGKENGSRVRLNSIVALAQSKNIIISAFALARNRGIKRLGHACISTGGKLFPKYSAKEEVIAFIRQNFHNKNSLNLPNQNSSVALDKVFKKEIHINISQGKKFPWERQNLLLRYITGDFRWEKEIVVSPPIKILISYLFSKKPIFSIIILLLLVTLILAIILFILFRKKKAKIYLSKDEVSRLKKLVHKETMAKLEAREMDSKTYNKLYQDTLAKNGTLKNGSHFEKNLKTTEQKNQYDPDNRISKVKIEAGYKAAIVPQAGVYKNRLFHIYLRETIIGRHSDATISFPDPLISSFHCKIKNVDGNYILFDTLSENGTLLNSKKLIRPKILEDWDEIVIGKTCLNFRMI